MGEERGGCPGRKPGEPGEIGDRMGHTGDPKVNGGCW